MALAHLLNVTLAALGTLSVTIGSSVLSATIQSIKNDFPDHNSMQYIMGELVLADADAMAGDLTPSVMTVCCDIFQPAISVGCGGGVLTKQLGNLSLRT